MKLSASFLLHRTLPINRMRALKLGPNGMVFWESTAGHSRMGALVKCAFNVVTDRFSFLFLGVSGFSTVSGAFENAIFSSHLRGNSFGISYTKLRLGSPFCNGQRTLEISETADNKNMPI